jgi:hypothetical protein
MARPGKYGFWSFIGDCAMFFITCGLWIIWIFVRELRYLKA